MSRGKLPKSRRTATLRTPTDEAVMVRPCLHSAPLSPVAGLLLASGSSSRYGSQNKLLAMFGGTAVVRRTLMAYLEANLQPVLLVVGHDAEEVAAAARGLEVSIVFNPDFELGQSRSLVRGIKALPAGTGSVVIGVGDQPFLSAPIIAQLTTRYRESGARLVVPRYAGVRGNPVLFDRIYFGELESLQGDQGGRPVLLRHADRISWVDIDDPRPAIDIDTQDDYRRALASMGRERTDARDP